MTVNSKPLHPFNHNHLNHTENPILPQLDHRISKLSPRFSIMGNRPFKAPTLKIHASNNIDRSSIETADRYYSLGNSLSREGELQAALEAYLNAIKILEEVQEDLNPIDLKFVKLQADIHLAAATLYCDLNEFNAAIEHCTKGYDACLKVKESGNEEILACGEVMFELRKCRKFAGEELAKLVVPLINEGTLEACKKAKELFQPHPYITVQSWFPLLEEQFNTSLKREIIKNLTLCHRHCNNENWEDALSSFVQVLEDLIAHVPHKQTYREMVNKIAVKMGKAQIDPSDKLAKALRYCRDLLTLSLLYDQTKEAEIKRWHHLAGLYLLLGNTDKAIQHSQNAAKKANELADIPSSLALKKRIMKVNFMAYLYRTVFGTTLEGTSSLPQLF